MIYVGVIKTSILKIYLDTLAFATLEILCVYMCVCEELETNRNNRTMSGEYWSTQMGKNKTSALVFRSGLIMSLDRMNPHVHQAVLHVVLSAFAM